MNSFNNTEHEFTKALNGDERSQLRQMVHSMALQLRLVTTFVNDDVASVAHMKASTTELAAACLMYLKETE